MADCARTPCVACDVTAQSKRAVEVTGERVAGWIHAATGETVMPWQMDVLAGAVKITREVDRANERLRQALNGGTITIRMRADLTALNRALRRASASPPPLCIDGHEYRRRQRARARRRRR